MFWRELKRLRAAGVEASEELRGWRWDSPPISPPPYRIRLYMSEVVNGYCDSRRDLYLRRVLRVEARPTPSMKWGAYLHEILRRSLSELRRIIADGVTEGEELLSVFDAEAVVRKAAEAVEFEPNSKGVKLAKFIAIQTAAELDEIASRSRHLDPESLAHRVVPILAEYAIDGSPLGLTFLKVDALMYDVVLEVKVGGELEAHSVALAGYAMALESDVELPVDYGLLVYVNVNHRVSIRVRPVLIGDAIRRQFLEARDEAMDLVESGKDPGLAARCVDSCPFFYYCHGASS